MTITQQKHRPPLRLKPKFYHFTSLYGWSAIKDNESALLTEAILSLIVSSLSPNPLQPMGLVGLVLMTNGSLINRASLSCV